MNTALVFIAMFIAWDLESSRSTDAKAFELGHRAAGALGVTKIMVDDYNQHEFRRLQWPQDFINDRDPRREESPSRAVFIWYYGETGHNLGHEPTTREILLAWRYGLTGAKETQWKDPKGYLTNILD